MVMMSICDLLKKMIEYMCTQLPTEMLWQKVHKMQAHHIAKFCKLIDIKREEKFWVDGGAGPSIYETIIYSLN